VAIWGITDITSAANAPAASTAPFGYISNIDQTEHVVYLGTDYDLHELSYNNGAWQHTDLSITAGAITRVQDTLSGVRVIAYAWDKDVSQHVLWWSFVGPSIAELRYAAGSWSFQWIEHPTWLAGSNPSATIYDPNGTEHIFYPGREGGGQGVAHMHELWSFGLEWQHNDLTALTSTPAGANDPSSYYYPPDGTLHVVYIGSDGNLYELSYSSAASARASAGVGSAVPAPEQTAPNEVWQSNILVSATAENFRGASPPLVGSKPTAYAYLQNGTQHVVYRTANGSLAELKYDGSWTKTVISDTTTGAPAAIANPSGYTYSADGTQHVVYTAADSHIYDLSSDGTSWNRTDLTLAASSPAEALTPWGDPMGFEWASSGTQHVLFGSGPHIYELVNPVKRGSKPPTR
jgi:hypothetical protein